MSSCSHLDHAPGDTSCADCLRLDDARRRLREADEEPSAAAMHRVWAGYTARRAAPKLPWSWALGAALAAGLAAVWLLSSSVDRTAPELLAGRAPWVAPADTQLSFAGGQLAARAGATLALDHPEVLRLSAGELRWIQPSTPAWLSTPHALVRAGEAVVIAPAVSAPAVAAEPHDARIDEPTAEAHAALEPERDDDTTASDTPPPRDERREATRARAAARAPSPRQVEAEAAPAVVAAAAPALAVPEAAPAPSPSAPAATVAPAPVSPTPEPAPAAPPPELAQARAILSSNPEGARALTEALRRQGPSPAIEVEALMIESDAARRSGDLSGAVALCERVIAHPSGHSFAEEAMLRGARIHGTLGAPTPALSLLERARQRYPRGALRPEREALAAALLRSRGELERATVLIEALPLERGALALAEERVTLAEAWLPRAPARARALAAPVAALPWPEALRTRAAQVLAVQP